MSPDFFAIALFLVVTLVVGYGSFRFGRLLGRDEVISMIMFKLSDMVVNDASPEYYARGYLAAIHEISDTASKLAGQPIGEEIED